ncbi:MAG TPA: hypothetical protein VFK42_06750, partial [Acidimicrobiales bacterium]|nr:hypothetical protein [Acidimicrobiales bacterium]
MRQARRAAIVLVVAWAAVAIALVVFAARDGRTAKRRLDDARARLTADATAAAVAPSLRSAERRFGRAADNLSSPVLAPIRLLPVVGRQVTSARALARAGRDVSAVALDGVVRLD